MSCSWLPPLRLDVVDVRVLALPDRLHDLADVHAVLDHRVADGHVLQRHLVADRNILPAFEFEGAVLIENEAGERRSCADAFDDDDGDRVFWIVQYAMDHGGSWAVVAPAAGAFRYPDRSDPVAASQLYHPDHLHNFYADPRLAAHAP